MWLCVRNGIDYTITKGSYVGQIRRQLPYVVLIAEEPSIDPFTFLTPPNIPAPTSAERIQEYFLDYIIGDTKGEGEDYTYGECIAFQVDKLIQILNESKGYTNQASVRIGGTASIFLDSPPCLQNLNFKVYNGKLQLSCNFRSWDLFAGLPENLAGLQLFKEFVIAHLKFEIKDGPIIAFSDGLHLYEQYFDIVNSMNVDKITIKECL